MNDKGSLIDQLRIHRDDDPVRATRGPWPWAAGGALLLAGLAVLGYHLLGAAADTVPVRVAIAAPADGAAAPTPGAASILDASGYVVARRRATVSSKITGKVAEVLIEEGQHVARDQVIARLDDSNHAAALAQAVAQLEQARANLEAARIAYDNELPIFRRHQEQFERDVISAQAFDTARAAYESVRANVDVAARAVEVAEASLTLTERNLDDTIIRAPFAGVVTVKAAQQGEMVSPVSAGGGFTRTGIGTIVDMDSLEGEVDVSENFINRVRPGQRVNVRLNAYPDWTIPGSVIAIIPTADRSRATVRVRIRLHERDERVLPEMGLRVSFLTDAEGDQGASPAAAGAIIVPIDAVRMEGDTGVVFVIRGDRVERRAVRLGANTADGQIVLAGIGAGTRLAAGNVAALEDGARIQIGP